MRFHRCVLVILPSEPIRSFHKNESLCTYDLSSMKWVTHCESHFRWSVSEVLLTGLSGSVLGKLPSRLQDEKHIFWENYVGFSCIARAVLNRTWTVFYTENFYFSVQVTVMPNHLFTFYIYSLYYILSNNVIYSLTNWK